MYPDNATLSAFFDLAQQAITQSRGNDQISKVLYAGNQNQVCQLMLSISQMLNDKGSSTQDTAVTGNEKGFPLVLNLHFCLSANIPAQNVGVAGLTSSFTVSNEQVLSHF